MSDPKLDPALREMLDAFTVPPLSPGFADRVVAAARGQGVALPPAVPSRRDRRGRWIRGHRVVIGMVAFGLMSAAAAATAIFGDAVRTMPVIGQLIASVAPARPTPSPRKVAVAKPKPVEAPAAVVEDSPPVEVLPLTPPERRAIRREFVAERIATGLARRDERRRELGLPPRPPGPARIIPILRRIPPADRAAIIERVREIRQEQRTADIALPDRAAAIPELNSAIAPAPEQPAGPMAGAGVPVAAERQGAEILRTPERIEQLRRLRVLRELQQRRREMRRQRLQQ